MAESARRPRRAPPSRSVKDILREQTKNGWKLGKIAVTSGMTHHGAIQDALMEQVEEEIFDVFMWQDAAFEFKEGGSPAVTADNPLSSLVFILSRRTSSRYSQNTLWASSLKVRFSFMAWIRISWPNVSDTSKLNRFTVSPPYTIWQKKGGTLISPAYQ